MDDPFPVPYVLTAGDWLFWLIILAVCLWIYLFPAMVAHRRRHHNRAAISLLNVCLGWTVLGWVAALVWSVTAIPNEPGV